MLDWLSKNVRTFILAFFLAVAVWVSAVTSADPDETRSYPTPVTIEIIGQNPGMIITNSYTRQIEVVMRAPKSAWSKLLAEGNPVRAVVDISNLSSGSHLVPIQVQVSVQPVRVLSTTISSLELVIEPLLSRHMSIDINLVGTPAIGYEAQQLILSDPGVVVSGPESVVKKVKKVSASIDVTGVRQNVETEVNLQALDENNLPLDRVNIAPQSIKVTVPIIQQGGYRDLAVKVVVSGRVANGYRLTSILVNPPVVTVYSSDIALIDSLPGYVETVQLDLSGVSADIETSLALNLPEGVSLLGDQTVLVQVGISPIEGSLTLPGRPVTITGLSAGFIATFSPQTVDLYLSGPLPLLDTLIPTDILVSVDVTGLVPGTYQLTPTVTIMITGIRVESILPGTVEVIISRATPTPKP
jgi:YbbR domain-containing protein